jgi:DNA-binding CsgD family transcriptional regulator
VLLYLTGADISEDLRGGDGLQQIALDLVAVAAILVLLLYIYVLEPLKLRRAYDRLSEHSIEQSHDLDRLAQISRKQLIGLGAYIKAQFEEWELTPAEQDVALLLLKGLSMKEIAEARQVAERTTRQQATVIYGKTGLSGRASLSAFFLEDLLLPSDDFVQTMDQNATS